MRKENVQYQTEYCLGHHGLSWRHWLFARLQARIAAQPHDELNMHKQKLFRDLTGNVLEIGPGTGANLPYYPRGIHWIGIEPNPYMHPFLQNLADELSMQVELRNDTAEQINMPNASVDAVVSTLVLCSVQNVEAVLQEIKRVLRPGGRFIFIEHVAAPRGTFLRRAQRLIRPLWRAIGDGCTPDRETWVALEQAGFASVVYERFDLSSQLSLVRPIIAGTAVGG